MHVAVTRAAKRLILSGALRGLQGLGERRSPRARAVLDGAGAVRRPGTADGPARRERGRDARQPRRMGGGRARRAERSRGARARPPGEDEAPPATVPQPAPVAPPPWGPAPPRVVARQVATPDTLSYSSLAEYRRCPYSWYLRRALRLPDRDDRDLAAVLPRTGGRDAMLRGSIAHAVLEHADLRPGAPAPDAGSVRATAAGLDAGLDDDAVADQLALAGGFLDGPLRERAAHAADVRREVVFALPLDPAQPDGPLLNGVIDLLVLGEPDGRALVIDYKTDRVAPGGRPRGEGRPRLRDPARRLRPRGAALGRRPPSTWSICTSSARTRPSRRRSRPPTSRACRPSSPRPRSRCWPASSRRHRSRGPACARPARAGAASARSRTS